MNITLPTLPTLPENPGTGATSDEQQQYHTNMLQYQSDRSNYYRTLQTIQQQMTEDQTIQSNLDKSRHDALMAIANNLR